MHNSWFVIFVFGMATTLALFYLISILYLRKGWLKQLKKRNRALFSYPPLCVLVPARDEESNIGRCLRSLIGQDYPGDFRIIVLDDFSSDRTAEIVESFPGDKVKLIRLSDNLGPEFESIPNKKRALMIGTEAAESDWLLLTDADTAHDRSWMTIMMNKALSRNYRLVSGPVKYFKKSGLWHAFLALDQLSLSGIAGATLALGFPTMANGANLLVKRNWLLKLGFGGNTELPTGDDYFLLSETWRHFPNEVAFCADSKVWVETEPAGSFSEFLHQRKRWLSKSKHFGDVRLTLWLSMVYMLVGLILVLFFINWPIALVFFVLKSLMDMVLLSTVLPQAEKGELLFLVPFVQPLYMLYVLWAGPAGLIGNYSWKGRKVVAAKAKA